MKTGTQTYRELKKALFSEAQATALVEILQTAGVIEPEAPESELDRIEQYLLADPFAPSAIELMGGQSYQIERREQCGFNRRGSIQVRGSNNTRWCVLNSDHSL